MMILIVKVNAVKHLMCATSLEGSNQTIAPVTEWLAPRCFSPKTSKPPAETTPLNNENRRIIIGDSSLKLRPDLDVEQRSKVRPRLPKSDRSISKS